MKPLNTLELPWKLLITGFSDRAEFRFRRGRIVSDATTEMADGKPGLSLDDITLNFYGADTPKLISKVRGTMKRYFCLTGRNRKSYGTGQGRYRSGREMVRKGAEEKAIGIRD